jgi:hypothetical protein
MLDMKGKKFTIEEMQDLVFSEITEIEDKFIEMTCNSLRSRHLPIISAKAKEELLELDYKRHACFCTLEILDEMEKAEA